MAQVDLAAYRFALLSRNLIYKWERHQENPSDPRFTWDTGQEGHILEEFFKYFKTQVSPHPDFEFNLADSQFFQDFKDFLQENILDKYNQVTANLPPPDVVAAYENELARMATVVSAVESKFPTLSQARVEMLKRLNQFLPNLEPSTAKIISLLSSSDLAHLNPTEALQLAANNLTTTAETINQSLTSEGVVSILESYSKYLGQSSEQFAAVTENISSLFPKSDSPTIKQAAELASQWVATTTFLGNHGPSNISPTSQLEAQMLSLTHSPAMAAQINQFFTNYQSQLGEMMGQFRKSIDQHQELDRRLTQQLALNPNITGEALEQTLKIAHYVTPFVLTGHALAIDRGTTSEQVSQIDQFLARIGYFDALEKGYNIRASARLAAQQAIQKIDFTGLFSSVGNVQTFYALKTSSSARLQAFLQDLQSVEVSRFGLEAVTQFANQLGLTTNFDQLPTVISGRNVNQVSRGLFDALIREPAHSIFVSAGRIIRLGGWKNLLASLGLGSLAGSLSGPAVGVGASLIPLFIPTRYLSLEGTILGGRLVRSSLGRIGKTFLALCGSIAGISLGIFLLLPLLVALILFIINNSAYIVPQAVGTIGPGGIFPAGCPASMWPVAVNQGQQYYVSQGPGGTYTHGPPNYIYQEAIDINPRGVTQVSQIDPNKHLVLATHPGTVVVSGMGTDGGNRVHLVNSCGGDFRTVYVHMSAIYVTKGQTLKPGDVIGVIGQTGFATYPHLHYDFRNNDGSHKNRQDPPPFMVTPYIPKTVPQYCSDRFQCNISIP